MVLTFGIVWVVLGKYGFPVITKMVEGRKNYIDQSLAVAKGANEQIAKLKEENAVLIANAGKEQGRIIKEAMQERDKIIAQAQVQARAAAQKEVDDAKERIRQEQEEAIRAVRRQVAALSVDIAEKVVRKQLSNEDEQMAMIDRMLDDALSAAKANSN
jgi:F-type H+-transporting ATPase subunit b